MRYAFAECILDTRLYTLHREGTTVRLRPKAFQVLQYLLEHRDHVVSKDELCAHVWPGQFISDATLEGCITLARRAIGDSGRVQRFIESRRGYGYRFVGTVQEEAVGLLDREAVAAVQGIPPALPQASVQPQAVGREAEFGQLHRWLDTALTGARQVVFVTGEAGLGKTTLVEAFVAGVGHHQTSAGRARAVYRTLWLWGSVSACAGSPWAAVSGTGRSGADRVFRPVCSYLAGTDALAPQPY